MTRSVAIIGAGQIGFSAVAAFLGPDWDIRVCARNKPSWLPGDFTFEHYELGKAPAPTADVVIDTIAYDEEDVARYDPGKVGRLIVISSASVYCDDAGRTLDEAAQNGFPEFNGPITESQQTIAPGPATYSTRKVRMENKATETFGDSATILRPCAIYGPFSRHPREWWFVKRMLDGRKRIPLAFGGDSQFHTTSAQTIGKFALAAAEFDLGGIFNLADNQAADVAQIGRAIAGELHSKCEFITFEGPPQGSVGRTPWSVPLPFIVSTEKAHATGWDDFTIYPGQSGFLGWLEEIDPADWRSVFPQLAAYPWDLFDYEAEDRFFDEQP